MWSITPASWAFHKWGTINSKCHQLIKEQGGSIKTGLYPPLNGQSKSFDYFAQTNTLDKCFSYIGVKRSWICSCYEADPAKGLELNRLAWKFKMEPRILMCFISLNSIALSNTHFYLRPPFYVCSSAFFLQFFFFRSILLILGYFSKKQSSNW